LDQLYQKYRVLWLQPIADGRFVGNGSAHCCADMTAAVVYVCDQHDDPAACPDHLIAYNKITDEYALSIHDGSGSVLTIKHCPFCGMKLPDSRRDQWFDAIEALGFTDPFDDKLPEIYKTDAWWRSLAQPQEI
jgi:hypothetical protein